MGTNQIVEALKERNEDFEWYPTTQEIVDRLAGHIFKKRTYDSIHFIISTIRSILAPPAVLPAQLPNSITKNMIIATMLPCDS